MTSIKGYIEMLLMGAVGAVNENQAHFLEIVRNNIDRLNALVGDLLDVSRIESGNVTLAPEELELGKLAAEVVHEYEQKAEQDKKTIAFTLQEPRAVPTILGDPERVRQILRTLLDNAYHYTPENGSVQVKLRGLPKRSEVQLEVVDSGIGISSADQARVFERFFRGENSMVLATPGTGLGLSIAKQLVEMHHGTISLQSDGIEGHGSTFTITLPVFPHARSEAKRSPSSPVRRKAPARKTAPAGTTSK
jgi:signal transduction histidine kinase